MVDPGFNGSNQPSDSFASCVAGVGSLSMPSPTGCEA